MCLIFAHCSVKKVRRKFFSPWWNVSSSGRAESFLRIEKKIDLNRKKSFKVQQWKCILLSLAHLKERPSSAIYPSDSLRQSLLGSRRGRSSLLLSKSVSTNNIAGWVTWPRHPVVMMTSCSKCLAGIWFRFFPVCMCVCCFILNLRGCITAFLLWMSHVSQLQVHLLAAFLPYEELYRHTTILTFVCFLCVVLFIYLFIYNITSL